MNEGKRQKQISSVLIHDLNEIFQRMGLGIMDGGMISISSVKVTPDLLEARIYLSLFQVKDAEAVMKRIEDRSNEIKKELATRIKHQVRRIPILRFFKDDTLDNVFKMEELFKNLNKEEEGKSEND